MKTKDRTYVWSFIGRLSHWILALSFIASFITSFYENLLSLHVVLGLCAFFMFLMKIFWGIMGPYYAQWKHYEFAVKDLRQYFENKIKNRFREIKPGHNPASSWFAFLIIWIGIISCILGLVLYGMQEGNGIFSFLNDRYYIYSENFELAHIIFSYLALVMILTHIVGVLIEHFYHKTSMIMAMVSGYKKAKGKDVKVTAFSRVFGVIYLSFVISISLYAYYSPQNILTNSKFQEIDYKKLHADFYYECSDCHNLIPPYLLPKQSWQNLLRNQNNHFEEDLELDDTLVKSIESFLIINSAENSTRESSHKINKELSNSNDYSITKTNYWKKVHSSIPEEIFKSDTIETKSNCVGCHEGFEKGILSDINITYFQKNIKF